MDSYKISDEILEKMSNGKFLKKDMRLIKKEIYKLENLNTKGYKEIDLKGKLNSDKSIVIFNIGQWSEEKENNRYDYDFYLFNNDGVLVYDESDGELVLGAINEYYKYINSINVKNNEIDNIRKKLFYPYL